MKRSRNQEWHICAAAAAAAVHTYPAIATRGIGLNVSVGVVPHHRRPPAAAPPWPGHARARSLDRLQETQETSCCAEQATTVIK